jgi:hypothetical protein
MPIEIKELHIHVVVNAASGQAASKPQTGTEASNAASGGGGDKDTIVAECVEQVLEILQHKRER